MTLRPLLALTLALATAGCASPNPWRNPNLPKDQWARDWTGCKRQAGDSMSAFHDDDTTPDQFRDYDRAQTKKRIEAELSLCMRQLGYTPVPK